VRYGRHSRAVCAGDVEVHPPGEAPQLTNPGDVDLPYLLVADNPPADGVYYPDSDKWTIAGHGTFKRQPVGYFVGEEPGAPTAPDRVVPPPIGPDEPLSRFARIAEIDPFIQASPNGRFGATCIDLSFAPGIPHQTTNHGPDELEVIIITANPVFDSFVYPDSEKHGSRALNQFYHITPTDYVDGEEWTPRPVGWPTGRGSA
jgi:hypothetical protein